MPVCGNYLFFELPKKIVLNPKDGNLLFDKRLGQRRGRNPFHILRTFVVLHLLLLVACISFILSCLSGKVKRRFIISCGLLSGSHLFCSAPFAQGLRSM